MTQNKTRLTKQLPSSILSINKIGFALILFLLFGPSFLYAQEEKPQFFFKLKSHDKNKDEVIGKLLYQTKDSVVLQLADGLVLPSHRSEIKHLIRIHGGYFKKGRFYSYVIANDKSFAAPHAIGLKSGEVYFENTLLAWNELNAGITDRISVRIGFDAFSIFDFILGNSNFDGRYEPALLISPKFSYPIIEDLWNISLSPAVISFPDNDRFIDYGALFLSNTLGNKKNNFTIGFGTRIFGDDSDEPTSFITISGTVRLGSKLALISENWIIIDHDQNTKWGWVSDREVINSVGLKIIGNYVNTNIAFIRYFDPSRNSQDFLPIPFFSISIPISKRWGS